MAFHRFPLLLSLALLCCAAGGCIDHAYDTGRMDRNISVGGPDLTIPLGSTRPMTVESLIGDRFENLFELEGDGVYRAHYRADSVDFIFAGLKDYDGSRPFSKYTHYPISTEFDLFRTPANLSFDAKGEADLSSLVPGEIRIANRTKGETLSIPRMPDQLLALESITLTDASKVRVTFSIPNCLLSEGVVTPTIYVDLSQFFENKDAVDGVVTVVVPLTPQNNYTRTVDIPLHKLVFNPDDFDASTHTLTMDARIGFSGTVAVSGAKTTRTRYQRAPQVNQLHITAELLDLTCESIVGCYDYTISQLQTRVDLKEMTGDILERIGDPDAVLDFSDPEIMLSVESNISVPTYASIDLTAMRGRRKIGEMKGIAVPLPTAEPGGSVTQQIRLGKTAHSPDDVILDFTELVRLLPDEIVVDITGYTYKDRFGEVRVKQVYQANVSPRVNIPLALGPALQLTLRDTLDLPAGLDSLLRENRLTLCGNITNTLPLRLDLDLEAFSQNGTKLFEPVSETIAASGTSSVSLPLVLLQGAQIDSLSKACLTFRVSGTPDGRPVLATDYVSADLKLKIPGGYHTTF